MVLASMVQASMAQASLARRINEVTPKRSDASRLRAMHIWWCGITCGGVQRVWRLKAIMHGHQRKDTPRRNTTTPRSQGRVGPSHVH